MLNKIFQADVRKFQFSHTYHLIYADPPYLSDTVYIGTKGSYIDPKISLSKIRDYYTKVPTLLTDNGIFVLQCDWHAVHKFRWVLDEIFGPDHFVNEIIWWRSHPKRTVKKLSSDHDTLLVYCKGDPHCNMQYVNLKESSIKRYDKEDEHGRFYYRTLTAPGSRNRWDFGLGETPPEDYRGYSWTKAKIQDAIDAGKIVVSSNGKLVYKSYYKDSKGRAIDDVWTDIHYVQSKEKIGYPTQKPLLLMERLLKLYTKPNDRVLEMFCGSATMCYACHLYDRYYTGIDINKEAVSIAKKRLGKIDIFKT